MAEIIGVLGVVSVVKDVLETVDFICKALNDFRNADEQTRRIVSELVFVRGIMEAFKERLDKRKGVEDNIYKDVAMNMIYTKELLENYKHKLLDIMSKRGRLSYALFGGKKEIVEIRAEMLSAVCRISYYANMLTSDDTDYIKHKIVTMHDASECIKCTVEDISNDVKRQLELVLKCMPIVHYREDNEPTELIRMLETDGMYTRGKDVAPSKSINGLHVAVHDGCDVIVHKAPDAKKCLNNVLSVTKFVRIIGHDNMLPIKSIVHNEDKEELFVISNYDNSMITLEELMKTRDRLDLSNISEIVNSVAKALAFMHRSCFVHKCVRSSNIVVCSGSAKLTGFHMSRELISESGVSQDTESLAERIWLPKERLCGGEYTTSCDVYSFGIMIMELYIWSPLGTNEMLINVDKDKMRDTIVNMFNDKCKDNKHIQLAHKCTEPDATKRIRSCTTVVRDLSSITATI